MSHGSRVVELAHSAAKAGELANGLGTETAAAVLVLPVRYSAFRRLAEAAAREGVDVHTLNSSLLMYRLGRRLTHRFGGYVA